MRKAMIVFFAAIILVSACFMSLHCVFLGVSDDVTVTRQTLYGDSSVADGVNILVRNQYQQNLMWETSLTLGSNPVPETEFTFSNEQKYCVTRRLFENRHRIQHFTRPISIHPY